MDVYYCLHLCYHWNIANIWRRHKHNMWMDFTMNDYWRLNNAFILPLFFITCQIIGCKLEFFLDHANKAMDVHVNLLWSIVDLPIECFVTGIPCESIIDDVEVFRGHARVRVELAEQIRVLEQQFQKFIPRSIS